jgi:hypothetical protein
MNGKKAAGAEWRLERRRDERERKGDLNEEECEEEADKTREEGQDGQLNLMALG